MAVKINRIRSQVGTPQGGVAPGNPQIVSGADVGGALMQAAAVGANILGERAAERKREQAELDAATGAAWSARYLGDTMMAAARERQRLEEASGDTGEGVVQGMTAFYDQRIEHAKVDAPNTDAQRYALLQLTEARARAGVEAYDFEVGRRKEWASVEQDKGVEAAASAAAADYAGAAHLAAQQVAAIRANPLFSPVERRQREVAAVEAIAMGAAIGEAERNPYGMRRSILSSFGMGGDTPQADVLMARDSAIALLEKTEAVEGFTIPEDRRAEAVVAVMSGGGVSVNKATGEINITRGDTTAPRGPWAIEALSVPQRAQLLSKVDTEIARREADAKQRAEAGKVFIQQRVADTKIALRSGEAVSLPSYAEVVAGFGPERGALEYREMQILQQNAPVVASLESATNEELAAIIADKPTGVEDRSPRQESYAIRATIAQQVINDRNTDPGGDTLRTSPVVKEAYDAWLATAAIDANTNPDAPQLAANAQRRFINTLFGEQRRRGIAVPKLPEAFVDNVARTFDAQMRDGDPEVAARSLEATARSMLGEPEALAQLSAKLSASGRFAVDGVPGLTIRRMQEQEQVTDAQRSDQLAVRGTDKATIEAAVVDEFADLIATFEGRPGGPATQARYLEAAKIYAADAITSGRATDANEAARIAYRDLYGERNQVAGGLRIPGNLPADRVTEGLRTYLRHAGATAAIPIEPGMTEAETRAATTRALERNGRWVTNNMGDGAVLFFGGDAVKDVHGRQIEVKYADAALIRPLERTPPPRVPRAGRE